jgi:hypothetical protein
MGHLHYRRHFSFIAGAAVLLILLQRWDIFSDALLPSFAVTGALHAAAVVLSLRTPQGAARKCSFIGIAALFSVLTLYIGILGLRIFGPLPASERLSLVLALCAASGAITYGSLIRFYWVRKLSSRSILAMAIACVLVALLAFWIRGFWQFLEGWWLAAAWWLAFSCGLWYFDTHNDALTGRR